MKKLLLLPIIILPLFGCIATTAVVVGTTAGGAIIYDKRSFKTMQQDNHASRLANYWVANDSELKGRSHISINVFDNIALVVGQAQTDELRQRAEQLVKKVPDIKRVYNGITVAGAASQLQRVNDSWITSKVRTALLAKGGLNSNDIKVVTEAGVVYLMGRISRDQADLAADAARQISGVTKVVKVFEYT